MLRDKSHQTYWDWQGERSARRLLSASCLDYEGCSRAPDLHNIALMEDRATLRHGVVT